jgi:hypothetical protein
MSSAKSLSGLMKWLSHDDWREAFFARPSDKSVGFVLFSNCKGRRVSADHVSFQFTPCRGVKRETKCVMGTAVSLKRR